MGVFRYPGGKTKLLKKFQQYLVLKENELYYEPFIGGGSVTIHIAKKYPDKIFMVNDLDRNIWAFWTLISQDNDQDFNCLYQLLKVPPTIELFDTLRAKVPIDVIECAYYAIFFNRTTFSGIAKAGPIGGKHQTSKWKIDCRYNAETLIKEIECLRVLFRKRLIVTNLDYRDFLNLVPPECSFIYLDPPYFKQGKVLYNHYIQNHAELRDILTNKPKWVLSYDKCDEIVNLYSNCSIIDIDAKYTVKGHKKICNETKECVILPNGLDRNEIHYSAV
jgi:DNA adenine methylase